MKIQQSLELLRHFIKVLEKKVQISVKKDEPKLTMFTSVKIFLPLAAIFCCINSGACIKNGDRARSMRGLEYVATLKMGYWRKPKASLERERQRNCHR